MTEPVLDVGNAASPARRKWAANPGVLPLVLALVAAVPRFWDLNSRGLWYDESFSAALARLPLADMVAETARDIHPPLYYALLHGWTAVAGDGEASLRALSAVFGVLGVLLIYWLGVEVGGRRLGLAAGLAAALSPFLVLYSQEARMYTLLVAAVAGAGLFAWRAILLQPARRWAVGYVFAATAAAYTHNTAPFAIIGLNVAYLLLAGPVIWRGWRQSQTTPPERGNAFVTAGRADGIRLLGTWLACQAAVLLLFAPWLAVLWEQTIRYVKPGGGAELDRLVEVVGLTFALGEVPAAGLEWAGSLAWALAAAGLVLPLAFASYRRRFDSSARGAVFAALWLVVAFAVLYVNVAGKRDFVPRYISVVLPAFYLLLGLCFVYVARLRREALVVLAAVALAPTLMSLNQLFRDPYDGRPDHGRAMQSLAARLQPGDLAITDAPYLMDVFSYYYRGTVPGVGLPADYPPDNDATRATLEELVPKHERVWLFLWQDYYADPESTVERWLSGTQLRFAEESYFGSVRIRGYEVRDADDTLFDGAIKLESYEVVDLRAGWEVKVRLRWRSLAPLGLDYQVFAHLVDDAGRLVGQHDGAPNGGKSPTSTWKVGDVVYDEHVIRVPASAGGTTLSVRVGLYGLDDGKRLRSGAGDSLLLAREAVKQ